ncbi:MAG TPA: sigma-70 family RNA polymerase sigma factor [Streptosporangiaceae bacterium]|nr:sigma-70 family RNA polymerase sigma factor [Streptosporangiaceae bacterium]
MDDRRLVEAMRSRDPAAIGAVYTAYAERIFAFCWFLLRSREAAEVALRDTLIVAAAHIDKLRDPGRFRAWLYAIARIECDRRAAPPERSPDIPIASHDQDDVDQRIMAWGAVMGLPWLTREVLEMLLRHQLPVPDIAAVLAVVPKEVEAALVRCRAELETALTAELLAHDGPYGCPGRAVLLRARQGELTSALRTRLRRHAEDCEACGVFLIEAVSPAKVYALLPYATPARGLRQRVLSCLVDPELAHYRDFVAGRFDGFTKSGFPIRRRRGWDRRTPYDPVGRVIGPWRRLLHIAGGVAATAAIAGTVVALVRWAGAAQDRDAGRTIAFRATPSVRVQPTPVRPGPHAPVSAPEGNGANASSLAPPFPPFPAFPFGGCDPSPSMPSFARSSPLGRVREPFGSPGGANPAPAPTRRVPGPPDAPPDPGVPRAPRGPENPAEPTGPGAGPSGPPTFRPSGSPPAPPRPSIPPRPAPSPPAGPAHPPVPAPPPSTPPGAEHPPPTSTSPAPMSTSPSQPLAWVGKPTVT